MTQNDKKTPPTSADLSTPIPETASPPEWIMTLPDGTPGGVATAEDRQLAERGAALLAQDAHFQALAHPVLRRVEVNAGVASTDAGHLCLRYDVQGGTPQEFWPHWGKADRVSWNSGQVSVRKGDPVASAP